LEVGLTFYPGWPGIPILPLSASQIARIAGVGHQHGPLWGFLPVVTCTAGSTLVPQSPVSKTQGHTDFLCPFVIVLFQQHQRSFCILTKIHGSFSLS
jgi:hypothetical protein